MKAWFYPGENYGHDFVYPKAKAVELAKANKQPVASMPDAMAANTTKPTKTMQEPHVMAMKQAPSEGTEARRGGSRDRRGVPAYPAGGADAVGG